MASPCSHCVSARHNEPVLPLILTTQLYFPGVVGDLTLAEGPLWVLQVPPGAACRSSSEERWRREQRHKTACQGVDAPTDPEHGEKSKLSGCVSNDGGEGCRVPTDLKRSSPFMRETVN